MREIKYKAYLHDEKVIVDVIEINLQDKVIGYYDCSDCKDFAEEYELMRSCLPNAGCPIPNCDLMQYTGLKDRNGIEIYEGYIMKYTIHGVTKIDEIVYKGCSFSPKNAFRWSINQDEVIGNVYENPELLNKS